MQYYNKTMICMRTGLKQLLLVLTVLMISACGMKGDLYLPEEDTDKSTQKTE
jgi:predicted small lipoprotein YifL